MAASKLRNMSSSPSLLGQSMKLDHWYAVYEFNTNFDRIKESSISVDSEAAIDGAVVQDGQASQNRLSLLSTNMQADQELALRTHLSGKLQKSTEVPLGSSLLTVEEGKLYENETQVYYNVLESSGDGSTQRLFLVCFMVQITSGLELFHEDLDTYCSSLMPHLEKYMESTDISEYLKQLESWYDNVVGFVERCLEYLSEDLAVVIYASFTSDAVLMDESIEPEVKNDIQRFVSACSLPSLMDEYQPDPKISSSTSLKDLAVIDNPQVFTIRNTEEIYTVEPKRMTSFCKDCVRSMRQMPDTNPFKIRQLVENYKLKCIQDMNTFRRQLKQAETDYYALYRTYLFLAASGNGMVLLRNAKLQNSVDNVQLTREVISTLENFILSKGGIDAIEKFDRTALWRAKMIGK